MRKMLVCFWAALAIAIAVGTNGLAVGDKDYTIKDVMQKAHAKKKDGTPTLLAKVTSGKASDEEAKTLLAMYQSLAKQKPPAGDADAWKAKTKEMVEGAKLYVDGKKDEGAAALKKSVQCMACHKEFKG